MSKLKDLTLHEKECEFARMVCDKQECLLNQKEKKNTTHLDDCPYAVIVCPQCNKQMRRLESVEHDCVRWLLSVVDGLTVRNEVQGEEITELH